jgi:hypothetical protein
MWRAGWTQAVPKRIRCEQSVWRLERRADPGGFASSQYLVWLTCREAVTVRMEDAWMVPDCPAHRAAGPVTCDVVLTCFE